MSSPIPTGRISAGPSDLVAREILAPQFDFEVTHLLPGYVRAEQALLAEYLRMGIVAPADGARIAALLAAVTAADLTADPATNLADIAFALEQYVLHRLPAPVPGWHVDRSRNDLQASAQLLYGRSRVLAAVDDLLTCFRSVHRLAGRHLHTLMPGYTHLQPAQVQTPGFYLAGLGAQVLQTARRLLEVHDGSDLCPLGAGAMTGQELAWDRERMAGFLGFGAAHPHPLTATASRTWHLETAGECSTFGVVLSRFVTDLMTWGSGEYRFIDLPDELAGISSAMPQKKNFPVLERIRGRTAHLTAGYLDIATVQRATPFSNSVEVSKEGAACLHGVFEHLGSVLRLLTVVLDGLSFRVDELRAACEREYFGGFALANALTLQAGIPWRTAQVIAGGYVVAAGRAGLSPGRPDPELLRSVAADHGYPVAGPGPLLAAAFDPEQGLLGKQTSGSAHPVAVRALLGDQLEEAGRLDRARHERLARTREGAEALEQALSAPSAPGYQEVVR